MDHIISALYTLIADDYTLLCIFIFSLLIKAGFFITTLQLGLRTKRVHASWHFLVGLLFAGMFNDLAWIAYKIHKIMRIQSNFQVNFFIRLAWLFNPLLYGCLALLIISLRKQNFFLKARHKFLLGLYIFCGAPFLYFSIFGSTSYGWLESAIRQYSMLLIQIPITVTAIVTIFQVRRQQLPKIIRKQMNTLLIFYIVPFLTTEGYQVVASTFNLATWHWYNTIGSGVSAFFLTISIYFSLRRVLRLRFLNLQQQVHAPERVTFLDHFNVALEDLSKVITWDDLALKTQKFFSAAFDVPADKVIIKVRRFNDGIGQQTELEKSVENFLNNCLHQENLKSFLQESKVLVYDEITCSNFYQEEAHLKTIIRFLDEINADIFMPIHDKRTTIAYLIIEREARGKELYTNVERDQMLMYGSYLSNIIYLLQNKNFDALIQRERLLKEELYHKHQEVNQYKESIRSFIRNAKDRKIGVIFYKNKHFVFGNQAGSDLIGTDINTYDNSPVIHAIKTLTRQVEQYKNQQHAIASDLHGNKLALSAIPGATPQEIIITVHTPEISDVLREQIDRLPEPSDWDHLLSLQTTKSGHVISQLIPGQGPTLLQMKISLLKAAMNKQAMLLELEDEDALAMGELVAHLSLCQQFHPLSLERNQKNLAAQLFGTSQVFGTTPHYGLLKDLDENGTLFIKDIHYMDIETQELLAHYIRTGSYTILKSELEMNSETRIICSTNQDLGHLVREGTFSASLYEELQKNKVVIPSLLSLPKDEFLDLVNNYAHQATPDRTYKNFLELSAEEKDDLAQDRPVSLRELKKKIQTLLLKKTKEQKINHSVTFDSAYLITDPELAQAARLGKHALRDQRLMTMLWNKFKNPAHIATFLGVNRTSVYRRCKEFDLL
jgi:hypothetical protein